MDILLSLAFSTHLGLAGNYNEFHPHVRIQDEQYIAGAFFNSENRTSFYLGREYTFDKLGIELGVVTGYPDYAYDIAPMARATYQLSDNHQFYIGPAYEVDGTEHNLGIVFGLEFHIK